MESWKYQWTTKPHKNNRTFVQKKPQMVKKVEQKKSQDSAVKNSAKTLTIHQRKYLRKLMESGLSYNDAFPKALAAEKTAPKIEFPVAVMHSDYPSEVLTGKIDLIRDAIFEQVMAASPEIVISFYSCAEKSGYFILNCANEASRDWLIKEIPKMQPWQDADLNAVEEKDVPKYEIFTTEIAGDDVLTALKKMNAGLKTNEWKILNNSEGQMTFLVDEESAQSLAKSNFKAFYGFGQVEFKKK